MNVCECVFFLSAAHKVTHHTDYLVENNLKTKVSKLSASVPVCQMSSVNYDYNMARLWQAVGEPDAMNHFGFLYICWALGHLS